MKNIKQQIIKNLTPDLLKKKFKTKHPLGGHCYVASEAFFHLSGGKSKGFTPMFISHEGNPHWWIKGPNGEVHDITASQFKTKVPYEKSIGKGFLTIVPSRRTRVLMQRINGS